MTKEEIIKEVYQNLGFEWSICSKYITENGVLILPTPDLKYSLKGYENLVKDENKFSAFGKEGLKLQPTELTGIYNNNGWIKIESEEDLPKDIFNCFVISEKNILINAPVFYNQSQKTFTNGINAIFWNKFTHYKPIEKPKLPIY